jgi:hypothetical protein
MYPFHETRSSHMTGCVIWIACDHVYLFPPVQSVKRRSLTHMT